ncbi:histidine acid [Colletotrichum karsti]|uniref:Histidine acid n=1 Tax=Colletotrichum karsti TaxID=1095194 RepID=A0A9P6HX23_9PEZI|nr:histidine acid [Colletotrichum karsti]KAF9871974.1 histidine acid [Colletotrichum karsti]
MTTATKDANFPLAGIATDGWSNEDEATATCLCGTVQLAFPTHGPGLVSRFVCHCSDCRKISSSMFCSNFSVRDSHLRYLRGKANLKSFTQSATIASGNDMSNYFCGTCGTLLYRVSSGYPGLSILRLGTIDDFHLVEEKMRPQLEQFIETRVGWLQPVDGMAQVKGMMSKKDIKDIRSSGTQGTPGLSHSHIRNKL